MSDQPDITIADPALRRRRAEAHRAAMRSRIEQLRASDPDAAAWRCEHVAALLSVSVETVRRMAHAGKIPGAVIEGTVGVGRKMRIRFVERAVRAWHLKRAGLVEGAEIVAFRGGRDG
jgi:excisionase family DNA binding protein